MAADDKEARTHFRNGEMEMQGSQMGGLLPSALVIGGAALLQPELLPGIAVGAAALLLPKWMPDVGGALRPLAKSVISLGYSAAIKTIRLVAEASEEVQDMIAEVRSEQETTPRDQPGRNRPSASKR